MNTPMKPSAGAGRGNLTPVQGAGSASRIGSISRAQRAAVVIAMLGKSAAKPIVDKLDDRALEQVSQEIQNIRYLGREELVEIVVDFLQHLHGQNGAFRGGPERARDIVEGAIGEARFENIFGEPFQELDFSPGFDDTWIRLEQEDPGRIAEYLNGLTPNLVAIILRKLDVAVASEIVTYLEDDKLDPTIGSMVETDHVDEDIDAVVAKMVKMEFLDNFGDGGFGGDFGGDESHLAAIGEMLSLVPSDKRDRMLAFLKSQYEGKFSSIERQMFTIESLPDILPRNAVPVVFRELDEMTIVRLLATLTGDSAPVQEYLLGNISSRLADQYRDQLGDVFIGSPEQAEAIQREFFTALMAMKRQGTISM